MNRIVTALALVLFAAAGYLGHPFVIEAGGGGHGCVIPPRDGANEPVVIKHSCFAPAVLYVEPGGTVEWRAEDRDMPHNVMLFDGELVEGQRTIPHGTSVFMTFDEPGVFGYYCELHPGMTGVIVVETPPDQGFVLRTTPERLSAIEAASNGLEGIRHQPIPPFQPKVALSLTGPADEDASTVGEHQNNAGAGGRSLAMLGITVVLGVGCVAGAAAWRLRRA